MDKDCVVLEMQAKIKECFGDAVFNILTTDTRKSKVVYARMIVAKFLRMHDWTIVDIGGYLNKDHATVSYYLKKFEIEYDYNAEIRELANKILK